MTFEPKNEERICAEVLRLIEHRTRETLTVTGRPERINRNTKDVELLFASSGSRYALEHTRIESFPGQIADGITFSELLEPLEADLVGNLPGVFWLTVDVGAAAGIRRSRHAQIRQALLQWVRLTAPRLQAPEGSAVDERHQASEQPAGVPFSVTLSRTGFEGSALRISRFEPAHLEQLRAERVQAAIEAKCPKLAVHRATGHETVLVFESNDIALGSCTDIGAAVVKGIIGRTDVPDRIYVVETAGWPWYIWTLKEATDVYPISRYSSDPVVVEFR